nr:MAG TPA: hypothetical protein [Caudoviricetes sp.]
MIFPNKYHCNYRRLGTNPCAFGRGVSYFWSFV